MSAVLATGSGVLLLAVVAAVGVQRVLRRLRPVRAWRWLAASVPWARRLRLWWWLRLRHPARPRDGAPLTDQERLDFLYLMQSFRDKAAAGAAARAEAEHWAEAEADR